MLSSRASGSTVLKKILLGVVVFVVAVLGYAATQPDSFTVSRRTTISAPADKIYANIADFRVWESWSPWARMDTAMLVTISDPPSGQGATYEWKGNSSVGSGRMEITSATPGSSVTIKLDFMEPFESHNTTVFALTPNGTGTDVVWTMSGPNNYLSKVMTTFMSMDKMVGGDFERGLQQLKTISER